MTRSVIVTTPIPTLEEFGKSLGLSKARQKALMQIMMGGGTERSAREKNAGVNLRKKSEKRAAKRP